MIFHAIGTPGQPVEKYVTNPTMIVLDAGQVIVEVGDVPDTAQTISPDGLGVVAVIESLEAAKADKWRNAKAYRNSRQEGSCPSPAGMVQIDADSQRKIAGAALAAKIAKDAGISFSVQWTLLDNTAVTLDADVMIQVGMLVMAYINRCQVAGDAIREAIASAADLASLDAIDLTAGYPA